MLVAMKETRLSRRDLVDIRVQFVRMMQRKVLADAIMAALGLGRLTFFKWKALYSSGDLDLEVGANRTGNPQLTEAQVRQLWSWIVGRDPRQFQFDFALWTRKIVGQLIRDRFGVEMTPQSVGKLLRRLGFSPQRPLYRAYQQNPEAVAAWREVEFPAIRAQAKQEEGAELYFADESWVRTDHHAGTTWTPVGRTPIVQATGERDSVNMISAITPRGVLTFETYRGSVTSAVFIEFLEKLLDDASTPVYVIVDNASQHTANAVTEYVATTKGRLKIFFLPAYSPELNPDEWVWQNIKNHQIGRKAVQRKSDFFELVTRALERLQSLPEVIIGFFRDPSLAYIST
jgi:transposase